MFSPTSAPLSRMAYLLISPRICTKRRESLEQTSAEDDDSYRFLLQSCVYSVSTRTSFRSAGQRGGAAELSHTHRPFCPYEDPVCSGSRCHNLQPIDCCHRRRSQWAGILPGRDPQQRHRPDEL